MTDPAREPLLERQSSRSPSHRSWMAVPKGQSYEDLNGIVPASVHNVFIRKVYTILAIELFYTACICSLFMFHAPLRNATLAFVGKHAFLYQIVMFASLVASICALMYKKNEYPANYWLLLAFVTVMGCNVGVVCAIFYAAGKGLAIAQAVGITGVLFLTLTAYAHWSKTDFNFMGAFLYCALMANILFGIVAFYSGSTWMAFFYHVVGVLIFCGFILYDTSMLIRTYGCEDWIIASIELYLDIINLFLHILALLGDR